MINLNSVTKVKNGRTSYVLPGSITTDRAYYAMDVLMEISNLRQKRLRRAVNNFTTDSGAARGEWMIGVSWHKPAEKFRARCCNPFTKKNEYLGLFTCEVEAHQAWLRRKLELAHELAAIQTDERVAKALILKYTNLQTSEM